MGLAAFGQKMKGYLTNEAQLIGLESRTSSPVRIPRDKESFEHPQLKRLFPCGEGAGYAGGIVSAAMDGERCAEKLVERYVLRRGGLRSPKTSAAVVRSSLRMSGLSGPTPSA
jgi:uncharacterized FAD-dependent dehydrogenase